MNWGQRQTIEGVGRVIFSDSPPELPLTSTATSIKFVVEGCERYVTREGEHWLHAGQFAVVQPGTEISGGARRDRALGLCLYFDDDDWRGSSGDDLFGDFQTFTAFGTQTGRILLSAARLGADSDVRAAAARLLRNVVRSLPGLAADMGARTGRLDQLRPATRRELFRRVEEARAHLHALDGGPTSLSRLAAKVGLSPFHLARAFKAIHDVSPIDYHSRLRLARARDLLGRGMNAASVSSRLGYSEPSAFSRAFRRRYGIAPGALRARSVNASGAAT